MTQLCNEVRNENTPVAVERIVAVKEVRFPGWQDTIEGRRNVRQSIRRIVWVKYKIKDEEVISRAYRYVEMYYKVDEGEETLP